MHHAHAHSLSLSLIGSLSLALSVAPSLAHAQTAPDGNGYATAPIAPAPYGTPYTPWNGYGPAPMPALAPTRVEPIRREDFHGGRVPAGATLVTERNRPLLVAGGVTFGALYVISAMYALLACPPGSTETSCAANTGWLYVPVVGPFLTAADSRATYGGRNLAIFDGFLQLGGVAMLIGGMLYTHQYLEYRNGNAAHAARRNVEWAVLPAASGAEVGATLAVQAF